MSLFGEVDTLRGLVEVLYRKLDRDEFGTGPAGEALVTACELTDAALSAVMLADVLKSAEGSK